MLGLLMLLSAPIVRSDAETAYAALESQFRIVQTGFLRESSDQAQPTFNWGLGVALSASNALAVNNPKLVAKLKGDLAMVEKYWNQPGFDVQPGPTFPDDKYYDDNAWMVLALVESFELLKDPALLERAQAALDFCLSGHDQTLGGGVWWRQREHSSKNTCSTAPTAAACLAIYAHAKEERYLAQATQLYEWTRQKLMDPKDHLMWDHITTDGTVERTKWSYNTALMIRTARELARITKEPRYGTEQRQMERAAIKHWIKQDGSIGDEMPFAHLLFENLKLTRVQQASAIRALLRGRNGDWMFGKMWGEAPTPGPYRLLYQASAVRALAVYERKRTR